MLINLGTLNEDKRIVLEAEILTAALILLLTIYRIITKSDFTCLFSFIFILAMLLIAGAIGFFFDGKSFGYNLVVNLSVVLVYSLLMLIIGGTSVKLSKDDYIIGTIILLVDLVVLFFSIIMFFGSLCSLGSSNRHRPRPNSNLL